MDLLQLAGCAFGVHRRSRKHVRRDGSQYRSTCAGCGKPMVRGFNGWRLDDAAAVKETA